jgi:hypothetical protein
MIVKRHHGLVEMISSPAERQRDLISGRVLDLLTNIDERLRALEARLNLPGDKAEEFAAHHRQIEAEIARTKEVYRALLEAGERPVATPPGLEAPRSPEPPSPEAETGPISDAGLASS